MEIDNKGMLPYSYLTKAKLSQIIPGGVSYVKVSDGVFRSVTLDKQTIISNLEGFRKYIKKQHEEGKLYIRKDKPGFPLTVRYDKFTRYDIEECEKLMHELKQKKK